MLFKTGPNEYLLTIIIVRYFSAAYGLAIYKDKELTSEEKRGAAEESKNEILTGEASEKSKTEKRGLLDIGGLNGHYGEGLPRPPGPPPFGGGYRPSGYDDRYVPGYPHSGLGNIGPSGHSYYGDDHRQGYGYPDDVRHRPGGYGPDYGPEYGGDYEEEHHRYPNHGGGGGEHGIGGFKTTTLKKILLPLAGLAILGVAAVASHNPILLQLGVANGRRKRSVLPPDVYPPNPNVRPRKKD